MRIVNFMTTRILSQALPKNKNPKNLDAYNNPNSRMLNEFPYNPK